MKKDDIEDLYSELEGFSKAPPEELWDNIEAKLHPEKKKRRLLIFWGSSAAVLVLFIGYFFTNLFENDRNSINIITDVEQSIESEEPIRSNQETIKTAVSTTYNNTNKDSLTEQLSVEKETLSNEKFKRLLTEGNKKSKFNKNQNQLTSTNNQLLQIEEDNTGELKNVLDLKNGNDVNEIYKFTNKYSKNAINKNVIKEADDKINNELEIKNKALIKFKKEKIIVSNDSASKVNNTGVLDLSTAIIAENENVNDSTQAVNKNLKWSVEVLGGLANTSSESSIQNTSINTASQNDFVYALKVGYALSNRLVVKSGIGKNILGQKISNINYTSTSVSFSGGNALSIVNNPDILFLLTETSFNDTSTIEGFSEEGTLQQQFGYVQVPLEFSYNLLKAKKIDLSVGFGGNVNFLTDNRVFIDNERIGESLGANSTIFGATMNSTISYSLAKKTILFLEPSYNYFEKPVDNINQSFKNTQFRALFGLRYKF
ncbi:hypothetical protein HNV10_11050 [Winogradskyella litoriviva]|uniref:Outer membrane protein beta-barrel domain-containing protein n=1 Tax=Winogradskyella litoriviva TaxID=1220182 RepID=A0ABX2E6P3_9FLAO|nr:hypothetical protein [Winogradskyella litoriviva]NRD23783.1 hypothetical protein [Winogradskyella litoriviva]